MAMKAADTHRAGAPRIAGRQPGDRPCAKCTSSPGRARRRCSASTGRKADGGADGSQALVTGVGLDVIFPVLHGPYGEDGTVQGLLELANIPYVGCGVRRLGGRHGQGDDEGRLRLARPADLRLRRGAQDRLAGESRRPDKICDRAARPFPVFVKPANLGSSVGISKAKDRDELIAAIDLAAEFDRKIIVEAGVDRTRARSSARCSATTIRWRRSPAR